MRLASRGIAVDVPAGWDARIYRRREEVADESTTHAVLHAANFALPEGRGDFGSGAVELMGAQHVLVVLLEHDPAAAGTALFANEGRPTELSADLFGPHRLQRTIAEQAGTQVFFHEGGRAFCLYVVLGSSRHRLQLIPRVHEVLRHIEIAPGAGR